MKRRTLLATVLAVGSCSDRIDIITEDGYPLAVYFDASDFYGKGLTP